MGIPRFFYWLYQNYPYVLTSVRNNDTFPKLKIGVDIYALDLNAIVHPICQQTFKYGSNANGHFMEQQRLLHPSENKQFPSKRIECYNKVCQKIEEMVNIVRPQQRLIIALDGTAGMSKQYQQRQRRFKSILERTSKVTDSQINDPGSLNYEENFDPNEITAGTKFMHELSICIEEFIVYKKKNDSYWKSLDVFFSNDKCPGEGEHKIVHILKQLYDLNNIQSRYCIHSPDADLIMLSLCSMCTHNFQGCYILRENIYEHVRTKYFLVNVIEFSNILQNKFKKFSIQTDNRLFISDFVLFCMFFGNDFLPEIPVIMTDKSGVDVLFLVYTETLMNVGTLTQIEDNKIKFQLDALQFFFTKLAEHEETMYRKKHPQSSISHQEFEQNIKCNIFANQSMDEVCHQYLKGLFFVCNYYMFEMPDWHWMYPFHHSPLFSDISKYLGTLTLDQFVFHFNESKPLSSVEQLIAVLPQESRSLLPVCFQKCVVSPESPLIEMFPDIRTIPVENNTLLVPFVNVDVVKSVYETYCNEMTKDEVERNSVNNLKHYIKKLNHPSCKRQ